MKPRRQSNFELLRIISMLMVLAVHIDGASLGLPDLRGNLWALDSRSAWQLAVESLTIVGVNCFTLISGYFGIRLRIKSVFSYLFQCMFYAVGLYALLLVVKPSAGSIDGLLESFMVLTHTDLWYVPAYFGLMLLSPFLNIAADTLGKRQSGCILLAFIIFNVWCGWLWGGSFNPTGYTLVQLIMMYLTGRFISVCDFDTLSIRRPALTFGTAYLLSAAAVMLSAIYNLPKAFAYNSPLVIAESILLFLTFRFIRIESRTINYVARSAFAVYLIHKQPQIFGGIMKPAVIEAWRGLSTAVFSLFAIALMAAIYSAAMAVDIARRFLDVKICKLFNTPSAIHSFFRNFAR